MMTNGRHFAFLRAINTGGRRISNEQILQPFVAMGFLDVAAYQAAGNVTFRADDAEGVDRAAIERAISLAYGFDTPAFIRSEPEIQSIGAGAHFSPQQLAATAGKVQVAFMRRAPSQPKIDDLQDLVPTDDTVVVSGREWYWLPTNRISDSRLPLKAIESLVGPMTLRTLGTITRMLARFGG